MSVRRGGVEDDPLDDPGSARPAELVAVPHPDGRGLGAAWILDGLQITIASSVTGVLTSPETLGMTSTADRADRLGLPGRRGGRRARTSAGCPTSSDASGC